MLALIVLVSILAPQAAEDDPRPTIANNGPRGAKAAYLTLRAIGVPTQDWGLSLRALNAHLTDSDAAQTTLIFAAPEYDAADQAELAAEVKLFLERGGRVLATGPSGALLLPGAATQAAGLLHAGVCHTTPEGPGALARAGSVEMYEGAQWSSSGPQFRIEQRCGSDAVVVQYSVRGATGANGTAIWWGSASPLENAELNNPADLRLLLASIGAGQNVIFDESLHRAPTTLWDEARGLPMHWLALQAVLLFLLLWMSFGRRRGPLRVPASMPRSSPLEFAVSMGDLYEQAGATSAATQAARRRLFRLLTYEAGVPASTMEQGVEAIVATLQEHVPGDWRVLGEHLQQVEETQHSKVTLKSTLALVQAMDEDAQQIRRCIQRSSKQIS